MDEGDGIVHLGHPATSGTTLDDKLFATGDFSVAYILLIMVTAMTIGGLPCVREATIVTQSQETIAAKM